MQYTKPVYDLAARIEGITASHADLRDSLTRAPALLSELDAIFDAMDEDAADRIDLPKVTARVDYIERELTAYAGEHEGEEALERAHYAAERSAYLSNQL